MLGDAAVAADMGMPHADPFCRPSDCIILAAVSLALSCAQLSARRAGEPTFPVHGPLLVAVMPAAPSNTALPCRCVVLPGVPYAGGVAAKSHEEQMHIRIHQCTL